MYILYCIDYYLLYNLFRTLNVLEKMKVNKKKNEYLFYIRVLILSSNMIILYYCILLNIQPLVICLSIYLLFDYLLLISRIIYNHYIIILIRDNSYIIIIRPTVGDNNMVYFRPTVVSNPILDAI